MADGNRQNTRKRGGSPVGQPGYTGNPGGRPKELRDVREAARQKSMAALDVLEAIANDPRAAAVARVQAATAILDRAWGKPAQPLVGDDEGPALRIIIPGLAVEANPGGG